MITAYLSLGSNMGDRKGNLHQAAYSLASHPRIRILAVSSLYETDPVGYAEQDHFLNVVISIETDLEPESLLCVCKQIEKELHRVTTFRNGPRTIDLDILLYDKISMDTPTLTIPHPRMFDRSFVMIPLLEVLNIVRGDETNHPAVRFFERFEDNFWLNRPENSI